MRNFKTRQRGTALLNLNNTPLSRIAPAANRDPSLTLRVGIGSRIWEIACLRMR